MSRTFSQIIKFGSLFGILVILLLAPAVLAQESGPVQEISGRLDSVGGAVYQVPDVEAGQTIYIYAEGTGGNLDPIIAVSESDIDAKSVRESLRSSVVSKIEAGGDPLVALSEVFDELFLAWDDDSGQGYDASLSFPAPEDGDYLVFIASNLTADTFGEYELTIGIDAPRVLTGGAIPTGDVLAFKDESASQDRLGIQEISGSFTEESFDTFFELNEFVPGDTIYAFVENTSGNLAPVLTLRDFGRKPIRIGNFLGDDNQATLSYTFSDQVQNYQLALEACCDDGDRTSGDYRLLVGLNAAEVLEGKGQASGQEVVREPIEVQVGLKLQQITGVDQKAENFGAVATFVMQWRDPALAFSPDECQCAFKVYNSGDFTKFAVENNLRWPELTLFNQQGNRWSQNQTVVVFPDGQASYIERFTATLQAPDFDFRRFPFDTQEFYIRIDSLWPEEYYVFGELEGYSEVGQQLGEEEWTITAFDTEISSETASTNRATARFSFGFEAKRHLSFYVIRILLPILIILSVSWVTFFLKDYSKRVDVAAGNLLLFIAFNFTISGDLPKLGYLTFLDSILISTFVVTALVVVFNVILRRLEAAGKGETAQRLDQYTIWIYPFAYAAATLIVIFLFS